MAVSVNQQQHNQLVIPEVSYLISNGDKVTLNEQIVRNLTNDNSNITQPEIELFIALCQAQRLNPFTREVYLIKLAKDKPAQMVTALGAFMRIADEHPQFDGIEDGIIVKQKDGTIIDREGCVRYDGEILVGGWAKVYRRDRRIPYVARVDVKEYTKNQATWNSMPMVMINKVAKVNALRKAFPQSFSGMYAQEEFEVPEEPAQMQSTNGVVYRMEEEIDEDVANVAEVVNMPEEVMVEETIDEQPQEPTNPAPKTNDDIITIKYSEYRNNPQKYEKINGTFDNDSYTIKVRKK